MPLGLGPEMLEGWVSSNELVSSSELTGRVNARVRTERQSTRSRSSVEVRIREASVRCSQPEGQPGWLRFSNPLLDPEINLVAHSQ